MSSRSPRSSISGPSSAEVAADFEESLKDLQFNNRYEISNLTIIAKENTEHAQAISKALENHIKTTAPTRKLPSLYVLDSIVKNVGTPYTVYLGRNLFSIFMDAYTLVDGNTRKNMEGMLKTWKEPVPGSIDPRPVFPADTVRPIENALIKAKTVAIQSQRQSQPAGAFRGTPTPPQHGGNLPLPPAPPAQLPYARYGSQQPAHQLPPNPYGLPNNPSLQEAERLKHDISSLIARDRIASIQAPGDETLKKRISALEALQHLLNTQSFESSELAMIRQQVSQLSISSTPQPHPLPQAPGPVPQWTIPNSPFGQYQNPPPSFTPVQVQRPPPTPLSGPQLSSETINSLQALLKNVPKPSTPQIRAAVPNFQNASHSQLDVIRNNTAVAAVGGTNDLLSSLAKHGLIKPSSTNPVPTLPTLPPAINPPPSDPTALLLQSLHKLVPPPASQISTPPPIIAPPVLNAVIPISASTLKTFRPELVASLYDTRPNQCSTCARRFPANDEGRDMKARHLDWHFRTNQRVADPNSNRGHHRNWFLDEMDWIRHVEIDLSTTTANGTAEIENVTVKAKKGPQDQFVRAPAGMTRNVCSICFEEMKSSYSEDLQDWIFNNATASNGKIMHATCLAEMSKSQVPQGGGGGALAAALASVNGSRRERSATPDSMLGKRKAESSLGGSGARLKTE